MATTRITYTDGKHEIVPITMRATCKAEAHAIEAGWGTITESPVRTGAYATYAALRMAGRNLPDFDHWLDTVASFDLATATEETEEGNLLRTSRVAQDSLGRLSFLLASRFGGTPWQWRNEADELDWGTGLAELLKEAEESQKE